jgi:enoyl-CoA hydratase
MTELTYRYLRIEVDEAIATVWLNRPPVNAVNQDMYKELHRLFSDIDQLGDGLRCVIVAGEGRHFCAGNELGEFESQTPENSRERMFHAREAFWAIRGCAVPTIAAVHGVALGTGLAIASSCDVIVASEDAKLGLPEIKVGVMGGAKHLSRLLSQGLVRLMFFTGEPLPAREFERFGGVVRVTARDALMDEARALAGQIVRHSGVALRTAKEGLNHIEYLGLREGYESEQALTTRLSGHPHAKEAVRAFREQREPNYDAAATIVS